MRSKPPKPLKRAHVKSWKTSILKGLRYRKKRLKDSIKVLEKHFEYELDHSTLNEFIARLDEIESIINWIKEMD